MSTSMVDLISIPWRRAARRRGCAGPSAIAAALLVLGPAQADSNLPVDVNGPHIILSSREPRSWYHATVELNGYFIYTITSRTVARSMCINASAFVVKPGVRVGRDFDGVDIHFHPETMSVRTVLLNGLTNLRVTKGLLKPLTPDRAALCVGQKSDPQ